MNKLQCFFFGMKPSVNSISFLDYPEPTGHAVGIYFTGCSMKCENCQNPQLQKKGKVYEKMYYDDFISLLKEVLGRAYTNKVVLLGGDPIDLQNREFTRYLIEQNCKEIDFCVYTGYDWNQAKRWTRGAKYVKCGKFEKSLSQKSEKTEHYMQFASSNQEVYRQIENEYILISSQGRIEFK